MVLKLVKCSEDIEPTPKSQSENQVRKVSGQPISENSKTSQDHAHLSDVRCRFLCFNNIGVLSGLCAPMI